MNQSMLILILKIHLNLGEHVKDTMVINYLHELNLKRNKLLINMVNMIIQLIFPKQENKYHLILKNKELYIPNS